MPFTPQQFLDAIATHELSPRKVARGWICLTRTGTILQRERDAKPTPEEAVEDAVARLQERDENLKRVRALEVVQAIERRRLRVLPRLESVGTPDERALWDVQKIDGTELVNGAGSLLEAIATAEARRPRP